MPHNRAKEVAVMSHTSFQPHERIPQPSCFCDPWRAQSITNNLGDYGDAELAADMNALTFDERKAIEEDIHGVSDVIEETEELVAYSIEQMKEALEKIPTRDRQAWDRAVFLRPALSEDRKLYLMCLRARRFRPEDAAMLLIAHFRSKRDLFGDNLLIHRITWQDLTEQEHDIFRSGAYQLVPNFDTKGRGVAFLRLCHLDIAENINSTARCIWYIESVAADYPEMQQKGVVTIADCGGHWKCSALQFIHFLATYPVDATPFRDASFHGLYNDPRLDATVRKFRSILQKDFRMRTRFHVGSSLETEYSLRTFGIDVSGGLMMDNERACRSNHAIIEEDIRKRQQVDERVRQFEGAYRDPGSPVALFPNCQDILMGQNKTVTPTWPGNILYHQVIELHVQQYVAAQCVGKKRKDKTLISVEIFHILQSKYRSRFLTRRDTVWVAIDECIARKKISQALRALASEMLHKPTGTSTTLQPISMD